MRPIDRLLKFMKLEGIKNATLERESKISNGYIQKQADSTGEIGSAILEKIRKAYPQLNTAWVLTGNGDMKKKSMNDEELSDEEVNNMPPSIHEGEAVEKWIKANHEITKFAPEVLGMTFQNLNHHLRKVKLPDSFRGVFELKTGISIENDILSNVPTDLEEKLRTWNINVILKELYEEIEKLKRK